ncbi:glycosyl transferase [Corynebacterium sp. HMSC058E07]|uniref:glycosyltransferase family 4 protein n=1 Tax=Corynebacterium sp. HMSC058E07 TaxID=1715157 RepID=UPI0008A14B71|nr:glycosyltransferase family 4 protein [Corynebacterium sp. HMSC058E07]OFM59897.1 glycosyl transferase [Corynebacterium sp. HMSC058E07]
MKVLLLCWRDTDHPEGGGSERYLERVGQHLAAQGHQVVFRTAHYPGSTRSQQVSRNFRFSRGGGNLTVYPRALAAIVAARFGRGSLADIGRPDVVVDTQNGVPFFASLVSGAPTVVLTHHCHREQWSVAGPVLSRIGWLIESTLSPWIHRRRRWVTVSAPSAEELVELGVPRGSIEIIRNGIDPVAPSLIPDAPSPNSDHASEEQTIHLVALSRLVPHKQIEHAMDAVAAVARTHPNVRLDIIGDGWWADRLRDYARELGIEPLVIFHGFVSEELKHRILNRASVHVMPSRKEGWGLAVIEAGQHGVPTVGYESSAGLRDSIIDGQTGLLCDSPGGLMNAVEYLLDNPDKRREMGRAAKRRAEEFSWDATGRAWETLLCEEVGAEARAAAGS